MTNNDFQEAMQRIGNRLVDKIKDEIIKKDLVASGSLRDSVEYQISGNDILVLTNYYLPYAEYGRSSGKIPSNFVDILEEWITNKGITPTNGSKRDMAWGIAMKTKQYGSARYRGDMAIEDVLDVPIKEIMDETVSDEFMTILSERMDQIFK